ncbi:hypothetical protein STEG23_022571 [Scotinomys teguina]
MVVQVCNSNTGELDMLRPEDLAKGISRIVFITKVISMTDESRTVIDAMDENQMFCDIAVCPTGIFGCINFSNYWKFYVRRFTEEYEKMESVFKGPSIHHKFKRPRDQIGKNKEEKQE